MCSDHERLCVIVTPRYFSLLLCSITESQIEYLDGSGCVLRVIVKCIHLEGLKLISHFFTHSDKMSKSLCNIVMSSGV